MQRAVHACMWMEHAEMLLYPLAHAVHAWVAEDSSVRMSVKLLAPCSGKKRAASSPSNTPEAAWREQHDVKLGHPRPLRPGASVW